MWRVKVVAKEVCMQLNGIYMQPANMTLQCGTVQAQSLFVRTTAVMCGDMCSLTCCYLALVDVCLHRCAVELHDVAYLFTCKANQAHAKAVQSPCACWVVCRLHRTLPASIVNLHAAQVTGYC
jgi:hypothetical protein